MTENHRSLPLRHDNGQRVQFRLWQISVSVVTVMLNAWLFTVGVVWGIAFLFLAKHILVAVLTAGLHYPPPPPLPRHPELD